MFVKIVSQKFYDKNGKTVNFKNLLFFFPLCSIQSFVNFGGREVLQGGLSRTSEFKMRQEV